MDSLFVLAENVCTQFSNLQSATVHTNFWHLSSSLYKHIGFGSEHLLSIWHLNHPASWNMAVNLLQKKPWPENFQQTSHQKWINWRKYFREWTCCIASAVHSQCCGLLGTLKFCSRLVETCELWVDASVCHGECFGGEGAYKRGLGPACGEGWAGRQCCQTYCAGLSVLSYFFSIQSSKKFFPDSFYRSPIKLDCANGVGQDLANCPETMARTLASGHFVSWPKLVAENGKSFVVKKPSVAALKLNEKLLQPWLGRTVNFKKLGHKDFILNCLTVVHQYWDVLWWKFQFS